MSGPTSVQNSTISFNVEINSRGRGVYVYDGFAGTDIESTIIADNRSAGDSTKNIGLGHPGAGVNGANNSIGALGVGDAAGRHPWR